MIFPGESKTIEAQMKNESKTDPVYVFVELKYSHEAWSLDTQLERGTEGADVYAYVDFESSGNAEIIGALENWLTVEDDKKEYS